MIRGSVIFFTLSFFILSSCQENQSITHVQFPDDAHTLVFFSDESNLQDEHTYYDAIIDLRNSFPDEVANLKVVHSENEKILYKQFNVKSTPSLIVIHHNEVVTQVEGSKQKEDIVVSIEQALNDAGDSTY